MRPPSSCSATCLYISVMASLCSPSSSPAPGPATLRHVPSLPVPSSIASRSSPPSPTSCAARADYRRVVAGDFLDLMPDPDVLYDRVIMNPPFDRERDIDHVIHGLDFLKPDGCLTAIMSAGTEFRETRKSIAFRALMEKLQASWSDMPPGSFASVGTYCNTLILRVWKSGRRYY
jgi:hypothetical protein